jgi:hypothetical protein
MVEGASLRHKAIAATAYPIEANGTVKVAVLAWSFDLIFVVLREREYRIDVVSPT